MCIGEPAEPDEDLGGPEYKYPLSVPELNSGRYHDGFVLTCYNNYFGLLE